MTDAELNAIRERVAQRAYEFDRSISPSQADMEDLLAEMDRLRANAVEIVHNETVRLRATLAEARERICSDICGSKHCNECRAATTALEGR